MAGANVQRYTVKELREAIEAADGNIVRAAESLGADRKTIYNYLYRYKSLATVVDECRRRKHDERLDLAETNLDAALKAGAWNATEYVLSTIGKKAGYIRGQQISGDAANPLEAVLMSPDEWKNKQRVQAERAGIDLTE